MHIISFVYFLFISFHLDEVSVVRGMQAGKVPGQDSRRKLQARGAALRKLAINSLNWLVVKLFRMIKIQT
jgi:hypothetical protein